MGVLALGHETVCFVSLGPGALVLLLRVFFVKNLLSSWYLGVGVALALTLARLLLRDFGPLVSRSLLPVLWWRCRPWVDPVLLAWTYHCFSLGAWSLGLVSSSVACHPSPFHGLARCGGWCISPLFEMLSVLFPGNMGSHFLGISRSVFGNVWFLLFLELLASSCPGSYGREGGSAGLGLHPPASMAPDPATRLSGLPH